MSEKEKVLSLEELEKSWTDSKALLKSLMEDESPAELSKAKKEKEGEEEGDDAEMDFEGDGDEAEGEPEEEESEAEEESEKKKKGVKKSMEDFMDADDEAVAAMDVEPFLRRMVKSFSTKIANLESANAKLTEALAKSLSAFGDQNLMIAATVQQIAETPVGSRSVIRKSMEKYPDQKKTEAGPDLLKSMSTDQILEKAVRLAKSGVLTSLDVAKINNRLLKGFALESQYVTVLAKEEK
jgi:hypothetical protein